MSKIIRDRKIEAIHDGYLVREPASSRDHFNTDRTAVKTLTSRGDFVNTDTEVVKTSRSRDRLDTNKTGIGTSASRDQFDSDLVGRKTLTSRDKFVTDSVNVGTSMSRDQFDTDVAGVGTSSRDARTDVRDKQALRKDVETIRLSLDVLKDTLIMQQYVLARDFEARIRHVYDDVINDLNGIRKRVNDIGDTFESDTKFKSWTPLMPTRKNVLQSSMSSKSSTKNKLKGSKSVDFVDKRGTDDDFRSSEVDFDKYQSKKIFSQRQSWLGSSQGSIISTGSSTRKLVPGFGCCFEGDGKTIPYRSHRVRHHSNRTNRHSWGPSRSVSRSTLDDDDLEDKGYLCGGTPDDWRAKVAPYMWEGWSVPGIDNEDIHKLRERMEHLEKMRHEIVQVQNEYRDQHGCPELCVTTELAREAQQWADTLAMRGFAQYNDSRGHGENILVVDIEDKLSGQQVVDTWYREGRGYNYNRPGWQRGTTNFTQIIWKSSQFVGVGIAKFPFDNTYVIVVQYQPKGNINTPAQFRQNVPPSVIEDESQVFESDEPLQNIEYRIKNESCEGLEESKLFHTVTDPDNDNPEMMLEEDCPEEVEINESLEKTETKLSNSSTNSKSEDTENTMSLNTSTIQTNTNSIQANSTDRLVAGLELFIENLTKRKRLGFDDSVQYIPNIDIAEDVDNNDGTEKLNYVDDDNTEEYVNDGVDENEEFRDINDIDDDDDDDDDIDDDDGGYNDEDHNDGYNDGNGKSEEFGGVDDEDDDNFYHHDNGNGDDIEEHGKCDNDIKDDGIEEHNDVEDTVYNVDDDDDDLIASVSASLASYVYDSSVKDGSTVNTQVVKQNREVHKVNQNQGPDSTSGKNVLRQSSIERKVTSV